MTAFRRGRSILPYATAVAERKKSLANRRKGRSPALTARVSG